MPRLALRAGLVLVAVLFASLPSPTPTGAIFHIAYISELMSGFNGDPDVQYVEVRMDFPGQNLVNDTRYTVWNADGSEFNVLYLLPHDVPNDGVNVRWIMATQAFADLTGMTPDFIIPTGMHTPSGMICWGGPDFAPPSDQWDPQFPFFYTDCVAYGDYAGGNSIHPPPSSFGPGDGTKSLTRIQPPPPESSLSPRHLSAPPDAEAFDLHCPTPENNAGEMILLGEVGDADSDGAASSIDAALVLQLNAGLITSLPCPEAADVNGDGSVNSLDAALILQFAAGLIPNLPP